MWNMAMPEIFKEGYMQNHMDKLFLLTYTSTGYDGFRHSYHSWFETEDALKAFVRDEEEKGKDIEVDLSIEILNFRPVTL